MSQREIWGGGLALPLATHVSLGSLFHLSEPPRFLICKLGVLIRLSHRCGGAFQESIEGRAFC